jgi:hypothetical protein
MLRHAVDPRAVEGDGAGARAFGAGDGFQQRRLAGAVGAGDADDLALGDLDLTAEIATSP